jgi:glycosyltransferase involved in cell wall biosynthesis
VFTINFYNLKSSNGLLYYALDYLETCRLTDSRVLVRGELEASVRKLLPNAKIIVCSPFRFLVEAALLWIRGDFVYTPTPHPLPFISRQMIVVHDNYPFYGRLGTLKRVLFKISLKTSRCKIAYINHSNAKAFLDRIGISRKRQLFAPNKFPMWTEEIPRPNFHSEQVIVVGLLGTDSDKKNYSALFSAVSLLSNNTAFRFAAYGHDTPYFRSVKTSFPDIDLVLIPSDSVSMASFLSGVSVVVSVATHEGFGRPIAAALTAGVPCLLLDCPVFREFFDGMAMFAPDVLAVACGLSAKSFYRDRTRGMAKPPIAVVDAFHRAAAFLNKQYSNNERYSTTFPN